MQTIQADFDRIALFSTDGWNRNSHYYDFLLRQIPPGCQQALEIGCGTGSFSRLLAQRSDRVLALDLSPQMIRLARDRSDQFPGIDFQVADVLSWAFPEQRFDCIVTIATLHHLPLAEMLDKLKASLKSGGVLLVLDLFEPSGLWDMILIGPALLVTYGMKVVRKAPLWPSREARAAWAEHDKHDSYPTFNQVRDICAEVLPDAEVRKHLLWRYSIVWKKPAD
jgi:SAM-dependent methyltransferase